MRLLTMLTVVATSCTVLVRVYHNVGIITTMVLALQVLSIHTGVVAGGMRE